MYERKNGGRQKNKRIRIMIRNGMVFRVKDKFNTQFKLFLFYNKNKLFIQKKH